MNELPVIGSLRLCKDLGSPRGKHNKLHIKLFPQCNEHLFFSVMRMLSVTNFQNGRLAKEGNKKKQSDFAMNTQHTPSLERRIHGIKIQNCMIDMILNRYRGPVSNLLRSAFNCHPPRSLAFLTAF